MPVTLPRPRSRTPSIQPPGVDPEVHPVPNLYTAPALPALPWAGATGYGAGVIANAVPVFQPPGYGAPPNVPQQPVGTAIAAARQGSLNGPMSQQLDYRRRLLASKRGIINLGDPYGAGGSAMWGAQQGVFNAQGNALNAQQGVFGAQGMANAADREGINSDIGMTTLRQGNYERLIGAQNDVADQSAVGQYNEYLGGRDRRNSMFGVAPEQRITLPAGQTPGTLPSGQVYAGRTLADQTQETNQQSEQRAGFVNSLVHGKANLAGADVSDARLTSSRADALVSSARLNESRVGANVKRERDAAEYAYDLISNDSDMSGLPPFPGAVIDPDTDTWVTRDQLEQIRYDKANTLEQERYGSVEALKDERAQAKAEQRRQEADARYPEEQAQREQRQRERTQRESGGSPLAAASESSLLGRLAPDTAGSGGEYGPPVPGTLQQSAVLAELIRRLMSKGYSYAQARDEAQAQIAAATARRQRVSTRGGQSSADAGISAAITAAVAGAGQ